MKKLLTLVIAMSILSCASETEQQGLDKIAELYNATTSYSKGFSSELGQKTSRRFNIVVSDSPMIDSLSPNVTSANIALMVYDGLEEKEKKKYDTINVRLLNLERDTAFYSYPTKILDPILPKLRTFEAFSESLINGDHDAIDALRNTEDIPEPMGAGLLENIQRKQQIHGKLQSYQPFGVAELSDEQGSAYQFQGNLVFNKTTIPYFIVTDTQVGLDQVIGFRITK